ncbi:MAG: flagellar motor switch phosphatase FliY [Clostridiales bacterium]|nr:flagellar motor switch phosphatase FliY [Clostridiales bacterium]
MDNMLSQEEINALLQGMNPDNQEPEDDNTLTDEEKDVIGELSNISMGAASTALSTLLNRRVSITTPRVSYSTWEELSADYDRPCVFIQIYYKEGLDGSSILLIKDEDVKYITSLMMGGDGTPLGDVISELELSAISEAMNQMMGSAATSLSTLINKKVDITPPASKLIDLNDDIPDSDVEMFLKDKFVRVSFDMKIGDTIDTNIMQLYPFDFAHDIYINFMESTNGTDSTEDNTSVEEEKKGQDYTEPKLESTTQTVQASKPVAQERVAASPTKIESEDINVQQAMFQPLSGSQDSVSLPENINVIMDVPLEVRVELGRTHKSIKEILDFAPGTIIELDKLSGEPVDVLVNDKHVALGEVVVIDEAFGIRITEILDN